MAVNLMIKTQHFFHEEMVQQGADIIDVGGESTRPGYQKITVPEEIERVTGIIEAVKKRFDIPVSIDTYGTGNGCGTGSGSGSCQ